MRTIVVAIAALLAAGALALALAGCVPPAATLAGWAAILAIGLAVERWRYRRLDAAPPPQSAGWQTTGERFVDPETGRLVTVYFHPATGERRYVASA
jgi:hypothetical protein